MEREELAAPLYDFLYRDSGRIASYYAQLFSGRLSQLEEIDSERSVKDQGAKVSVHIASGDVKTTSEILSSSKRIIDPHDLITTDVFSFLIGANRINHDIVNAAHGSLVLAKGTLVFVDKYMLEMAVVAVEASVGSLHKAKTQQDKINLQGFKILKSILSKLTLPSAFLLHASDGVQVAGTIKESGMEEPISSYYFKHGAAGLSGVYVIGIKEIPSQSFTLPDTQLLGAFQQGAQGLSDMMFPPEAIRVTPVALFRKL